MPMARMAAVSSLSLLFLSLFVVGISTNSVTDERFIGWLGETYKNGDKPAADPDSGMHVLSFAPRIFLYKKFLTPEECDELIKNAKPRLARSGVSDAITGAGDVSNIRTSQGMFFARGENEVVRRIEDRLAMWMMLDVGQGEGIQVLYYQKTQKYDPHHDYFSFDGADDNGGNRMATILMYLSDVEEGGETVFPKVKPPVTQTRDNYSECAMKGLSVKPRKGDVVGFWSIRPDGRFDAGSLHGSCPVIKGTKWSATKWLHVGHYSMGAEKEEKVERVMYVPSPPPDVPGCIDKQQLCSHWAESGECEDNPIFMVGSKGNPGGCIKSCNRCDLGPNE